MKTAKTLIILFCASCASLSLKAQQPRPLCLLVQDESGPYSFLPRMEEPAAEAIFIPGNGPVFFDATVKMTLAEGSFRNPVRSEERKKETDLLGKLMRSNLTLSFRLSKSLNLKVSYL